MAVCRVVDDGSSVMELTTDLLPVVISENVFVVFIAVPELSMLLADSDVGEKEIVDEMFLETDSISLEDSELVEEVADSETIVVRGFEIFAFVCVVNDWLVTGVVTAV